MKKLVYNEEGTVVTQIIPQGYCGACTQKKEVTVLILAPAGQQMYMNVPVQNSSIDYSICEDCARQVVQLLKRHAPIPGQEVHTPLTHNTYGATTGTTTAASSLGGAALSPSMQAQSNAPF